MVESEAMDGDVFLLAEVGRKKGLGGQVRER